MSGKLVVFLLLAAVASGLGAPFSTVRAVDGWTIAGMRDIHAEMLAAVAQSYPEYSSEGAWEALLLSPDGGTVVGFGSVERAGTGEADRLVCRYTLADRALACAVIAPQEAGFHHALMRSAWSPDGTRIVLHEDPFRIIEESDLWQLDVATLTFTNLTDDGLSGPWFVMSGEDVPLVDYQPMWSPDGDLYFLRMTVADGARISALYRMAGGQGEPEFVTDLPGDIATFDLAWGSRAAMSPDGTRIALLPQMVQLPVALGIWMIDLASGEVSEFLPAEALQVGFPDWSMREDRFEGGIGLIPQQIVWAGDGTRLLIYAESPGVPVPVAGTNNYLVIDVATRTVTPLVDYTRFAGEDDFMRNRYTLPGKGFLAPDGGTLFYLPFLPMSPADLFMHSVALPFDRDPGVVMTLTQGLFDQLFMYRDPYALGYLGQTSSSGTVLFGHMLITFE